MTYAEEVLATALVIAKDAKDSVSDAKTALATAQASRRTAEKAVVAAAKDLRYDAEIIALTLTRKGL